MSKRKYNNKITIEQRKLVLDELERGATWRAISNEFGISIGTVSSIKANKVKILECLQQNSSSYRKRGTRATPNDELNSAVYRFFSDLRRKNVPVTGPMLKAKALQVATLLEIDNFKASNGWLESFQRRHNVQFGALNGESAEVVGTDPVELTAVATADDHDRSATLPTTQSNNYVVTSTPMNIPPVRRAKNNASLSPVPVHNPSADNLPVDTAILKLCQFVENDMSDTFGKFGSLVASQLRSLPTAEALVLQMEIQQLITDRLIANCSRK